MTTSDDSFIAPTILCLAGVIFFTIIGVLKMDFASERERQRSHCFYRFIEWSKLEIEQLWHWLASMRCHRRPNGPMKRRTAS